MLTRERSSQLFRNCEELFVDVNQQPFNCNLERIGLFLIVDGAAVDQLLGLVQLLGLLGQGLLDLGQLLQSSTVFVKLRRHFNVL